MVKPSYWVVSASVTANRDLAVTAQQVSIAVVAAPSTFRRGLAAKVNGLETTHAVGAYLVYQTCYQVGLRTS